VHGLNLELDSKGDSVRASPYPSRKMQSSDQILEAAARDGTIDMYGLFYALRGAHS